jgi:glycosyltransferase involved in cell wall biosynthesis
MSIAVSVSVVIPTCNREESILRVLDCLNRSTYLFKEVIVVDSSDTPMKPDTIKSFQNLNISYLRTEKSVCIQRNTGIQKATSDWIFLCDDDIEVPNDYIQLLVKHVESHSEAGAVSGLVLQHEGGKWEEHYPITSRRGLIWKYIFGLGIWGEIAVNGKIPSLIRGRKNHLSKAGWPVVTDFSGTFFKTPVYGLGASLVKRSWLLGSPYDEVLDPSGIGDNYGVAIGFPDEGIHVLKNAFVYHHRATENRADESVRYYRRLLALHYFICVGKIRARANTVWFGWSLIGNMIVFCKAADRKKLSATWRVLLCAMSGKNPYLLGRIENKKTITPTL